MFASGTTFGDLAWGQFRIPPPGNPLCRKAKNSFCTTFVLQFLELTPSTSRYYQGTGVVPVESSVASVCVCFPIVVNEVGARSIPARVVAGAASCDMGEVSARVGDACTAAATLGRRHRRHIKVPLFWRTAWRRDWGREHRLGRAFHWRRDPRAADAHTGAAQIAERPCHVALSGFGKAKVIRERVQKRMCHHGRTHL